MSLITIKKTIKLSFKNIVINDNLQKFLTLYIRVKNMYL